MQPRDLPHLLHQKRVGVLLHANPTPPGLTLRHRIRAMPARSKGRALFTPTRIPAGFAVVYAVMFVSPSSRLCGDLVADHCLQLAASPHGSFVARKNDGKEGRQVGRSHLFLNITNHRRVLGTERVDGCRKEGGVQIDIIDKPVPPTGLKIVCAGFGLGRHDVIGPEDKAGIIIAASLHGADEKIHRRPGATF